MKALKYVCLSVALSSLVACGQIGTPEPEAAEDAVRPLSSVTGSAGLGGSETSPVAVTTDGSPANLSVTFTITGKQEGTATFQVYQQYTYTGSSWSGSDPITFSVSPRASSNLTPPTYRTADITLSSTTGSGTSTLKVTPFNLTNSNSTGAKLSAGTEATSNVHVRFVAPAPPNTAPSITVPDDVTVEAVSAQGTPLNFAAGLSASDLEDGDVTNRITCSSASGATFGLGRTTVTCSVTDSGNLSASRSFNVTVVDTTAPVITGMPGDQILEAAELSGAVATWSPPTANDLVDGLVTVDCDATPGNIFKVGITTVTCTATDSSNHASTASFTITVRPSATPVVTHNVYRVDFETAPVNRTLYNVKVGAGVSYEGDGIPNKSNFRTFGRRFVNGKLKGGNQVSILNLWGSKRLTLVGKNDRTIPSPVGGIIKIMPAASLGGPSNGKNGLMTLKSLTLSNVTNGATLTLYGDGRFIKHIPVAPTGAGESTSLTLDEPGVGFVQVSARSAFAVDDVVFEVQTRK